MARGVDKQTHASAAFKNSNMKKGNRTPVPLTQQKEVPPLLAQFRLLFTVNKFLGLYPYDMAAYRQQHALRPSNVGVLGVLLALLVVFVLYNLLIYVISFEDRAFKTSQSMLTMVINLFLTYISLGMVASDKLNAIFQQKRINALYERLRATDAALFRELIRFDNACVAKRIRLLMLLTALFELTIYVSGQILIDESDMVWSRLLWACACLPTFYNSLDKIWFAVTLWVLKSRFAAINQAIDELVATHEPHKVWRGAAFENEAVAVTHVDGSNDLTLEFLRKEFSLQRVFQRNRIIPSKFSYGLKRGHKWPHGNSELTNILRLEEKLNNLCQLHDELCEIGKMLNGLWSYPILMLMAHGFLIFTAQLYFFYCATQQQAIPLVFRYAHNGIVTLIVLIYTAGKCIYLIYLSWKTSMESKRTGICLHKCGVAADNNLLYDIVRNIFTCIQ